MMTKRALFVLLSTIAAGCGFGENNDTPECQTMTCAGTNTVTYEICPGKTAIEYKFGGDSCTFDDFGTKSWKACASQVEDYCVANGGSSSADGGSGDSSSSSGTSDGARDGQADGRR
jgi:hypothetical protein